MGDTLHARDEAGRLCTYTALARQLDQWFAEFDAVVIAAVMSQDRLPAGFSAYDHENTRFVELRAAGGSGARGKLDALQASISWVRKLVPLLRSADVVHLRTPCNVTLVSIPLARILSPRRYAIYAGAWDPQSRDALSYRVQRWMLRHFSGIVHVYSPKTSSLGPNLRPNSSPTFDDATVAALAAPTERRLAGIEAHPPSSRRLRVCCVGRFSANKNQQVVVRAAALLKARGVPCEVRFAGAGGTEADIRNLVRTLDLEDDITFLGRCDEPALLQLFEWADINVAPSFVEGFGRVILEGMALGCPAVCGPGAMQRAMLGDGTRGRQVDPANPAELAEALLELRDQTAVVWRRVAKECRSYASETTIEAFARDVHTIVELLDERRRLRS